MKNFIIRTITGIIFVAAIVASFLRPEAMVLLFSIVTGLTIWEFTGLVNQRADVTVNRFISTVAGVYLFYAMTYYCSDIYAGVAKSVVFIPYLVTIVYLLVAELYLKQQDPIQDWAYTIFNPILPLSVFVFLWVNDSGAYCVGSLIGKHKIFPRISPAKSWEGSIGGAVFVLAAAYAISYFIDQNMLSMPEWLGLGLVVVVFGTWGDLVESLFKRTLGIKDSGDILPGHGGMLDRFDSSLLAIPAAVIYLYTLSLF